MHARRARALAPFLLALLGACDGSASTASSGTSSTPNVVFVVLDTLRPDHLGCYGAARDTSPRLDAFAKEAVVFEDAQSSAPLTVASLLSLVTSLDPEVHQVQGDARPRAMSGDVTTLAEALARKGYATAAFTEGGWARPEFGLGQGFQTFPPYPGDPANVELVSFESRVATNVDRTLAWLAEERAKPFFLFFHTYEIHSPYRTREDFVRRMRPGFDEAKDHARVAREIETWNATRALSPDDALAMLEHLYQCSLHDLPALQDPDAYERAAHALGLGAEDAVACAPLLDLVRDLYDASVRYADSEVARLLDAIDRVPNTIVVVVSDHGEGLGQHGEMEHSNVLHEEALRVALLVRAPGVAPRRVKELVRLLDVTPTVLELCGADAKGLAMQGASLLPLMRGASEPARVAFSHARRVDAKQNPQYTVRTHAWRLVREPAIARSWLYDRAKDPDELVDVAREHPGVVARLEALLERRMEQDRRLRASIASSPSAVTLDAATLREMQALGYAAGEEDEAPPPSPPR